MIDRCNTVLAQPPMEPRPLLSARGQRTAAPRAWNRGTRTSPGSHLPGWPHAVHRTTARVAPPARAAGREVPIAHMLEHPLANREAIDVVRSPRRIATASGRRAVRRTRCGTSDFWGRPQSRSLRTASESLIRSRHRARPPRSLGRCLRLSSAPRSSGQRSRVQRRHASAVRCNARLDGIPRERQPHLAEARPEKVPLGFELVALHESHDPSDMHPDILVLS